MKGLKLIVSAVIICTFAFAGFAVAETVKAEVFASTAEGSGMSVGTVTFEDSKGGLKISLDLRGLPAGEHGFHVHEKPDCSPMKAADGAVTPAGGAGGHYDPTKSGKHLGPNNGGHMGDLPLLVIKSDGTNKGTMSVLLKNVKAKDFKNRAVMIHAGGDNYSDTPVALGGGGGRIACGIIN